MHAINIDTHGEMYSLPGNELVVEEGKLYVISKTLVTRGGKPYAPGEKPPPLPPDEKVATKGVEQEVKIDVLLRCPFCGGRGTVATTQAKGPPFSKYVGRILCEDCHAEAKPTYYNDSYEEATAEAAKCWNKRIKG